VLNSTTNGINPSPAVRLTNHNHLGLTIAEVRARLQQFGPSAVRESGCPSLVLEATILPQLFLHEQVEAAVIGGLLATNALLSLVQEGVRKRR
jgi:hypothetical protein